MKEVTIINKTKITWALIFFQRYDSEASSSLMIIYVLKIIKFCYDWKGLWLRLIAFSREIGLQNLIIQWCARILREISNIFASSRI